MQKRRYSRIKRRFPCELVVQGQPVRAIVTDISADGMFVQTHTKLEPGLELEVRLAGDADELRIVLRAKVKRARRVPQRLATVERGGLGLTIVSAPPEFYELVAAVADPSSAKASAEERRARREPAR